MLAYTSKQTAILEYERRTAQAYSIYTSFSFRDAETEESIDAVSIAVPLNLAGSDKDPFRARLMYSSMRLDGNAVPVIKGMAFAPETVSFSKEGYDGASYVLTKDTPGHVKIALRRSR